MHPQQNYHRLGGWLMFIKVMSIIFIVSYSLSMLASAMYSFSFGFLEAIFYSITDYSVDFYVFESFLGYFKFIMIYSLVFSILGLAASICVLVFLQKRNLKYFKLSFFAGFGATILGYIVQIIYYSFNPIGRIFNQLIYESGYTDYYYDPYPFDFINYINRSVVVSGVVGLILTIGLTIAWFFYFQRSQRVYVYFAPTYFTPPAYGYPQPPAYAPPVQQPALYAPQPYPNPAPSPAGYPAPPSGGPAPSYPQQIPPPSGAPQPFDNPQREPSAPPPPYQ